MQLPETLTPSNLDDIRIMGSRGRIAARLGVMATIYVREPHTPKTRGGLGAAIDHLLSLFYSDYRWRFDRSAKRYASTEGWTPPNYAKALSALDPMVAVEIEMHGAERNEDASSYALGAYAPFRKPHPALGFLTVSMPFAWVERAAPVALQRVLDDLCRMVRPFHGYAGLGILRHPNYAFARKAEPFVVPLARRFPGLELDQPVSHARQCLDGIKGVNWLTVLHDDLIDKLGGASTLADRARAFDLSWSTYDGGGILQAGPTPQLGDLDQDMVPESYATADKLLKPVRAVYEDVIIGERIAGLDRKLFTRNWLDRFEGGRP